MFRNEIIVKGNYVSGTIKKNEGNKDSSHHPYILHSGLNFGGRGGTTWTADKMREIAKEILDVAAEIDKQNGVNKTVNNKDPFDGDSYSGKVTQSRGFVADYTVGAMSMSVIFDKLIGKKIKIEVVE